MFPIVRNSSLARPACVAAMLLAAVSMTHAADKSKRLRDAKAVDRPPLLWQDPSDIATRNLFYGPGGKEHEPHGPFQFVKEDLDGTNPKFVVTDADGTKWKVKLGLEARPETAASRLVWAAGYFANEDYYLSRIEVNGLPRLKRGQKMVGPNGAIASVRLKREDEKKIGEWQWRDNPFSDTPALNGLRTLMALINNWDLKDENNSIYKDGSNAAYMVSDLGASFGASDRAWPAKKAKDNLEVYSRSKFIRATTSTSVDFQTPARPALFYLVNLKEFFGRVRIERVGRGIPRADAKRIGELLAKLSPDQIKAAFRASGYSDQEVVAFSNVIETRIRTLTDL